MSTLYAIVGLVALERIILLFLSERHARWLLDQGGVEAGRQSYALLLAIQAAWLFTTSFDLPRERPVDEPTLLLFLVLQLVRLAMIGYGGRFWTVRIVVFRQPRKIARGRRALPQIVEPLLLVAETPLLPLMFGALSHAALFTGLAILLSGWRVLLVLRSWRARSRVSGEGSAGLQG